MPPVIETYFWIYNFQGPGPHALRSAQIHLEIHRINRDSDSYTVNFQEEINRGQAGLDFLQSSPPFRVARPNKILQVRPGSDIGTDINFMSRGARVHVLLVSNYDTTI